MLKKPDSGAQINLLDLKPARNLDWEPDKEGVAVLSVPKFQNRYLVKWLLPYLRHPNFKIKLDQFGSYLWGLCDGNTTIGEISDRMKEKYGENFDPEYERIGKFVSRLIHDKFLLIKPEGKTDS